MAKASLFPKISLPFISSEAFYCGSGKASMKEQEAAWGSESGRELEGHADNQGLSPGKGILRTLTRANPFPAITAPPPVGCTGTRATGPLISKPRTPGVRGVSVGGRQLPSLSPRPTISPASSPARPLAFPLTHRRGFQISGQPGATGINALEKRGREAVVWLGLMWQRHC